VREEEIIQVVPAQFGWFAYGRDEQGGAEFLTPVALWALVDSSAGVRRVVGLTAHGLGHVTRVEELEGFVEYRHVAQEEEGAWRVVSPAAWDAIDLVLCLLFAAGSFYYYVVGVHFEDRAMSRSAGLLFLIFFGGAVVFLVRLSLGG
jgi:hypothetical protein